MSREGKESKDTNIDGQKKKYIAECSREKILYKITLFYSSKKSFVINQITSQLGLITCKLKPLSNLFFQLNNFFF